MHIDIATLRPAARPFSLNLADDVASSAAKTTTTPYICGVFAAAVIVLSVRRFISSRQLLRRNRAPYYTTATAPNEAKPTHFSNFSSTEQKPQAAVATGDMGPTVVAAAAQQTPFPRVDSVALQNPEYFPRPQVAREGEEGESFERSYAFFERAHFYDYEGDGQAAANSSAAQERAVYERFHVFDTMTMPHWHREESAAAAAASMMPAMPAAFSRRTVRVFGAPKSTAITSR